MSPIRKWNCDEDFGVGAETIQGNNLRSFLDLCFENAVYISLQHARWPDCIHRELERSLEPFLIRIVETKKWFGYDFTGAPLGEEYTMKVNLYHADDAVKQILLRCMDDIFMEVRRNGRLWPTTQTLEDLCIFSETGIIMGTVSHEHILAVQLEDQDVTPFGNWYEGAWCDFSGMPIDMGVFTDE